MWRHLPVSQINIKLCLAMCSWMMAASLHLLMGTQEIVVSNILFYLLSVLLQYTCVCDSDGTKCMFFEEKILYYYNETDYLIYCA